MSKISDGLSVISGGNFNIMSSKREISNQVGQLTLTLPQNRETYMCISCLPAVVLIKTASPTLLHWKCTFSWHKLLFLTNSALFIRYIDVHPFAHVFYKKNSVKPQSLIHAWLESTSKIGVIVSSNVHVLYMYSLYVFLLL